MGGWVLRAGTPADECWRYEQGQIVGFRFDCAQNEAPVGCAQDDGVGLVGS